MSIITIGNYLGLRASIGGPKDQSAEMEAASRILFPDPSFLKGIARVIDLAGALDAYNLSATPQEADWLAIRSDWVGVGADLMAAFDATIAPADVSAFAQGAGDFIYGPNTIPGFKYNAQPGLEVEQTQLAMKSK